MIERFPKRYYTFGQFRVDPVRRLLLKDGEVVPLAPKAFEMLLLLVENVGQVLEKRELLEYLWPGSIVEEANLTQTIYLLRRALADGSDGQQYIETMPKRGYRFVAEVLESADESANTPNQELNGIGLSIISPHELENNGKPEVIRKPEAIQVETANTVDPVPNRYRRIFSIATLIALLIAAALISYFGLIRKTVNSEIGGHIRSVAVLPFKPLNPDADDNYLGLGMADVVITRLSDYDQVVVQPISAVRKYDNIDVNPLTAGQELNVDAVLEGTLQRMAGRLRVTMRLRDTRDGRILWSGKFDENFTDIFIVQDSISEQIATALALNLTRENRNRIFKRYTENIEAYELYLKGRYWWSKRTVVGLNKAIGYFDQAISLSPDYALAYSGKADCYNLLSILEAMPPQEAFLQARAAATRALEIDDTLAEAYTSLAWVKWVYEWDWNAAETDFKRAIELSPGYAVGHDWYGVCLAQVGRFDEALEQLKQAEHLDPLSLVIQVHIGWVYYYIRKFDLAIERYRHVLEMDPNFAWAHMHLGQAYEQKGMLNEAIEEMLKAHSLSSIIHHRYQARLSRLYAVSGNRQEAVKMLNELLEIQKTRYVSPHSMALVYAGLGDKERAIEWLKKGMDQRAGRMVRLQFDPRFDNIRSDQRFKQILQRVFSSANATSTPITPTNS